MTPATVEQVITLAFLIFALLVFYAANSRLSRARRRELDLDRREANLSDAWARFSADIRDAEGRLDTLHQKIEKANKIMASSIPRRKEGGS